jgi:hypothetical protein
MPKLKAPEGATNCSHEGQMYEVDADGSVDVPDEAVAPLMCHGFTPIAAPELESQDADLEGTDHEDDADTGTADEGAEPDSSDEPAGTPAPAPQSRAEKRASRNRK